LRSKRTGLGKQADAFELQSADVSDSGRKTDDDEAELWGGDNSWSYRRSEMLKYLALSKPAR
jgi:hypothetical protein